MQLGPGMPPDDQKGPKDGSCAFDLNDAFIEGLWMLLRSPHAVAAEFSGSLLCFCWTMHRVFYFSMRPLAIWLIEILKVFVRECALDADKPRFSSMHGCI